SLRGSMIRDEKRPRLMIDEPLTGSMGKAEKSDPGAHTACMGACDDRIGASALAARCSLLAARCSPRTAEPPARGGGTPACIIAREACAGGSCPASRGRMVGCLTAAVG